MQLPITYSALMTPWKSALHPHAVNLRQKWQYLLLSGGAGHALCLDRRRGYSRWLGSSVVEAASWR